jgi:hypothetical protein
MTDERGCHDDEVQVQQHGSVEKELLQPACMCKCAGAADRGDGREVGIRRSERHAKWAHGLEEPCNLAGVGLGLGIGIGGGLGCLTVAGRPASGSTYYLSISAYCFEWEDTAGHKNCSSVIFRCIHACMQRRGFLDHPRNDTLSFCRCPAAVLINHPTTGYTSARGSTSMAPSPCHHVHVLQCNHTELVAVFSHTRTQCLSDRIRTTHASYIFVLLALHAPSNHHHPIARLPFDA